MWGSCATIRGGLNAFLSTHKTPKNATYTDHAHKFFGIIVTLLVKLLKTEEKVRTGHVTKN